MDRMRQGFIKFSHRPELNSVAECFKSILGVHSETGLKL